MIPNEVTADHEEGLVLIRKQDHEKLARIEPDVAIKLAHDLLFHADKVLQKQGVLDNDD